MEEKEVGGKEEGELEGAMRIDADGQQLAPYRWRLQWVSYCTGRWWIHSMGRIRVLCADQAVDSFTCCTFISAPALHCANSLSTPVA